MPMPDITQLDCNMLVELRSAVDQRIKQMRDDGLAELRTRFMEQANSFGLTVEDVLGTPKKRRGRRRKHESDAI